VDHRAVGSCSSRGFKGIDAEGAEALPDAFS
jgi:hypothetical protein